MAVTKRLRYEILRRDQHTCRYCGQVAPDVKLTIDHVIPTALGGTDDPTNLVTACTDCNNGKSASIPDAPIVADVAADALRWGNAMTYAAQQFEKEARWRRQDQERFQAAWDRWTYGPEGGKQTVPRDPDWARTVERFLSLGLTQPLLGECIEIAMRSQVRADNTWRYFCGVAWSRIREMQELASQVIAYEDER